jgi:hypothetical protein
MSTLKGHFRITRRAVEELGKDGAPVHRAIAAAGVPVDVVARDILDVLILGHWADFGQCHHFMRRFDGQSEREAYSEAVHWIWKNAADAARWMSTQLSASSLRGPSRPTSGGPPTLSSQALGNALHAVQDSFATGHALRERSTSTGPGAIHRVKRYAGSEKDGHEAADKEWSGSFKDGFSETGWFAVQATKELLRIVTDGAAASRGGGAVSLLGFESYRNQWLRASDALSNERDRAFDLIDRFYTGVRLGASNLKTISMDEEGLANALVREAGTNSGLTLEVFERLDEHYNSDADDVAEIYVNAVRKAGGPLEAALRSNSKLRDRLIKVMDEGWTSGGEKACIDYLKGLV